MPSQRKGLTAVSLMNFLSKRSTRPKQRQRQKPEKHDVRKAKETDQRFLQTGSPIATSPPIVPRATVKITQYFSKVRFEPF